ncbi:MAG: NAD(P)H-quinone oxidoreductase [Acidimicrobiales bacterium]|nr:NAD(P)H-quinone oxidoreductase [Acidimicrobiales bacterium]
MRCVAIVDGSLAIQERPDPVPGSGEVLVAIKAAGLNAADLLQRRGGYPAPPGSPADIPGLECAGVVAALGDGVSSVALGDRVMAVVGGGGQSTHLVIHERVLIPVPDNVTWPEAGGFPEAFATAHDALFTQCGLGMGERVLIHGAAGGVGTAAVQLAHAVGAHVTATVRNVARHDEVRALGADVVVMPDAFVEHGPFDVVLELVGAPNMDGNLAALATGGRISVIGVGSGFSAEVSLLTLMQKRASIRGSTMRARPLEQKADMSKRLERHALPLLADGRLVVPVLETFPLAEASAAYDRFAAGGKLGKIVLVTD